MSTPRPQGSNAELPRRESKSSSSPRDLIANLPSRDLLPEALRGIRSLRVQRSAPRVCDTIAEELSIGPFTGARVRKPHRLDSFPPNSLSLCVGQFPEWETRAKRPARWCYFGRAPEGGYYLAASHARYLYAFHRHLGEVRRYAPPKRGTGWLCRPAFAWQRAEWDLYFAQAGREVRKLDPRVYVRAMARAGFTHLEVNALARGKPYEKGVPNEVYTRFYTYCPALDQFVDSFLNRGIYPSAYLAENLTRMKSNAELAESYGLAAAMTSFEPRSVPDKLLARYPELRGARVDHPFRSFHPRYNLAVSHPVVQDHYRELVTELLKEVPQLRHLSIWSNDSGAGFEYTPSLYVGANGSAYLAREWSDPAVFTQAAVDNALDFLRLLRDAGRRVRPDFRVATRLEPFRAEREGILAGAGAGLDLETPSLLGYGWESPYRHPEYEDIPIGPFTIYNNRFLPEEKPAAKKLLRRDCRVHWMYAHGPVNNFEPLLGIPSPWLTHEKLAALRAGGGQYLAHQGGLAPPASVRWALNQEVFRRFQFEPGLDLDQTLLAIADDWVGPEWAHQVVELWRDCDSAVRGYAPNPLYFLWGVWYRILIRPLVPDIEKIPQAERNYYEEHLLSTHHNPTRFDLRRDVLFDLMPPPLARTAVARIDRHALPPLDRALKALPELLAEAAATRPQAARYLIDLRDRLEALRCWMRTGRNVSAWIAGVHGYLEAKHSRQAKRCRQDLSAMVQDEIANTRRLLELAEGSHTDFMALSKRKETTFLYDASFPQHLRRKIDLMEQFGEAEPRIDDSIQWRVARLDPQDAP